MPVVTFHVGMPKCATTTIQSFLAERAEWLAARGQVYERHPEDRTRNQGNAAQLAAFCAARDLVRMEAHLGYFLRSGHDVLLSSEILFDLWREDGFVPLREAVARLGYDLRVVVYLKRQDLWIESDFKQHVKGRSDWVGPFEDLLERRVTRGTLDYHKLLMQWATQVGREAMTVVPLTPSQPQGYAIERFLEVIGLAPPESGLDIPRQNVSPSAAVIEAARHIKAALIGQGLGTEERAAVMAGFFAATEVLTAAERDAGALGPVARRALLDRCAPSNAALARAFLGDVAPFEELDRDAGVDWVPLSERALDVLSGCVARSLIGPEPEVGGPSLLGRLSGFLRR